MTIRRTNLAALNANFISPGPAWLRFARRIQNYGPTGRPVQSRVCFQRFACLVGVSLLGCAQAASFSLNATNPGPITSAGREMLFDLSAVSGEIKSAKLVLSVNYSNARELGFSLVDPTGVVSMPILPTFGVPSSSLSMVGTYTVSDTASATWQQGGTLNSNLPPSVAVRAWQFGPGGVCLNLLGRFLEYDIDRSQPLTLRVARLATPSPGSGAINQATLLLETDVVSETDALLATGFEEPAAPLVRCQRPPLDLTPNGAMESNLSPLSLIEFSGGAMRWQIRSLFDQADFGPFVFGASTDKLYAGRFGGRSRMNLGFWNAASGTLNFSTGAGARSVSIPGDWNNLEHYPIPGDYDGDGITDLAMVYADGAGFYRARIRFSTLAATPNFDYNIDPRLRQSSDFQSGTMYFGPGQDTNGDGNDDIIIYARTSDTSNIMRISRFFPNPIRNADIFQGGPSLGVHGDRLVLGDWSSGPDRGWMVVRNSASGWTWFPGNSPVPVPWGSLPTDIPISIDADGDGLNDIAVYRPTERAWYLIRSSDGQLAAPLAIFGNSLLSNIPLGYLQGTIGE